MKLSELINTDCFLDLSINLPEVNKKKRLFRFTTARGDTFNSLIRQDSNMINLQMYETKSRKLWTSEMYQRETINLSGRWLRIIFLSFKKLDFEKNWT